jgi:hypothetical protein
MDKRTLPLLIIGLTMAGIAQGAPELSADDRRELARLEAETRIKVDGSWRPPAAAIQSQSDPQARFADQ